MAQHAALGVDLLDRDHRAVELGLAVIGDAAGHWIDGTNHYIFGGTRWGGKTGRDDRRQGRRFQRIRYLPHNALPVSIMAVRRAAFVGRRRQP